MDIQDTNRAAELEQYLKSRINSIAYRDLIKDIRVDEDDTDNSLKITLVPVDDVVTFSRISVRLMGADTEPKWRRKKKDAYGHVRGARPGVSPFFKEMIQKEAGEKLEIWRLEHPFSKKMTEFLSSDTVSVYFSRSIISTLRFLAGSETLVYSGAEFGTEYITAAFKAVPFKAVYYIATGVVRVSFSEANSLYKKLAKTAENCEVQAKIEAYLREKGIQASIVYTGRPGGFKITFPFEPGPETETVTVGKTYKRIVSAAYRTARDRAAFKKKEQEEYLKTCPDYGTFAAQAVLDTIEDNGNRLTAVQIINILRGTSLTEDLVFGRYTGKYRLLQKSEISDVIDSLERYGIIRKRKVHGQYQDYHVYSVTKTGRLFSDLQSTPVHHKKPVTEQEYYLALRAVRDGIGKITDSKKLELLRAIAERPGIFLTDPGLVLDCVELMGKTAEGYLKGCYAEEDRRTRRDILRHLVNAASGKGIPRTASLSSGKGKKKREKKKKNPNAGTVSCSSLFSQRSLIITLTCIRRPAA